MGRVSEEKREYEKLLNELFGVQVKWSRLSISELRQLVSALTGEGREKICERLGCQTEKCNISRLIDQLIPPESQGPLIKALKVLVESK